MDTGTDAAVVRSYATVQAFVDALSPFLRRASWAANLLLAPAFAPPPLPTPHPEGEGGGGPWRKSLFLATWSPSPSSEEDGSKPVLVLARVGAFPLFVSFTDAAAACLDDAGVVDRHVAALAAKLADLRRDEDEGDDDEWIDSVRRVMGPSQLSRPLAHAVGRLIGRQPVLHWTLTAAACTAATLRLAGEDLSPSSVRAGEVRRFEVGRDDEERLARLYQEFVHPPTPIDECRRHVRRTLTDEPGSRVFICTEKGGDRDEKEVIAGFLYLKRETPFNFAVSAVYTAPENRRRGIAGNLVRTATRWALSDHDHDQGGGGGGKREVCIFWMDEAAGRIYRTAGFGEDGMMGAWTSWTFDGLDPGPWPA